MNAERLAEIKTRKHRAWYLNSEDADELIAALEAAQAERDRLREAAQAAFDAVTIEINPCNYHHDDVCQLNTETIEAMSILSTAIAKDARHA